MDCLTNTVRSFIAQHTLLRQEYKYLVGVSGGADSVALLLLLRRLGYDAEAVHCNFQLRGEESRRDEAFVQSLCQQHDIPLHLVHFDTRAYAQLHKVSIEMAARELRYNYFEQLRRDMGAMDICVAHHQDDNVETILLNLLRGTGIHGLTGMRPRQGHVVRPLLCASRQQIIDWLEQNGQSYVTDSSNLVADVWRNKLRLNVIPLLLDITPQARQNILKTAGLLNESAQVCDAYTSQSINRMVVDNALSISMLKDEVSPLQVLFSWLTPYGFTSATIMQIAQHCFTAKTGSNWLSATHELAIDRERLVLHQQLPAPRPRVIPEPGNYVLEPYLTLRLSIVGGGSVSREPYSLTADADLVAFPLTLRPVAVGDRFVPLGMKKGSRLVSDFLTDRKLSLFDKRRQMVLADASGRIVWLVGQRPDERFRVSESTRRVLHVDYIERKETMNNNNPTTL